MTVSGVRRKLRYFCVGQNERPFEPYEVPLLVFRVVKEDGSDPTLLLGYDLIFKMLLSPVRLTFFRTDIGSR